MIHKLWGEKLRAAFNAIIEPSWNNAGRGPSITAPTKKMGPVLIHKGVKKSLPASKPSKKGLTKKATTKTKSQ